MAGILTSGVWKDNYLADTEFHCHVTNKRRGVVVSTGLNPCTSLYSSLGRLRVSTAVVYAHYSGRLGFIESNNSKKIGKILDRSSLLVSFFRKMFSAKRWISVREDRATKRR